MPKYTLILLLSVLLLPLNAQATPRSDEVLCEEVAYAVNESVTIGLMTQSEADEISDRCYELYVH